MGMNRLFQLILTTAPPDAPAPALTREGEARVMLIVLIAILIALGGLMVISIIRMLGRRAEKAKPALERTSSAQVSAWSTAGQRAEPIDGGDAPSDERGDDDDILRRDV